MAKTAEWTWLVYMAGDNNLEGAGRDDLAEMKKARLTDKISVIVQFDTEKNKATRYKVGKNTLRVIQEMPGVNCGDPKVLTQFIQWGIKSYPAQHYLLDVWNHGGGWENLPADYNYDSIRLLKPLAALKINRFKRSLFKTTIETIHNRPVQPRAIAIDVHSQDYLDNQELRDGVLHALPGGKKLDIIGCDACLMNMLEIAYEMKDTAGFMVGSEEVEPAAGWPYDTILKDLVKNPVVSSQDLCRSIVLKYGQYYQRTGEAATQSALDLAKVDATARAVSELADVLLGDLANVAAGVSLARDSAQKFEMPEYIDLGDFVQQLSLRLSGNAGVKTACEKILGSLNGNNLIIQNNVCGDQVVHATGLSIYFPQDKRGYSTDYRSLDFSLDYHWKDFLEAFLARGTRLTVIA
jgi:hypothetical protein